MKENLVPVPGSSCPLPQCILLSPVKNAFIYLYLCNSLVIVFKYWSNFKLRKGLFAALATTSPGLPAIKCFDSRDVITAEEFGKIKAWYEETAVAVSSVSSVHGPPAILWENKLNCRCMTPAAGPPMQCALCMTASKGSPVQCVWRRQ